LKVGRCKQGMLIWKAFYLLPVFAISYNKSNSKWSVWVAWGYWIFYLEL